MAVEIGLDNDCRYRMGLAIADTLKRFTQTISAEHCQSHAIAFGNGDMHHGGFPNRLQRNRQIRGCQNSVTPVTLASGCTMS